MYVKKYSMELFNGRKNVSMQVNPAKSYGRFGGDHESAIILVIVGFHIAEF